jgi:hypothetical protein
MDSHIGRKFFKNGGEGNTPNWRAFTFVGEGGLD